MTGRTRRRPTGSPWPAGPAGPGGGQFGGPPRQSPGRMVVQLAGQHPDRERQAPAKPGDLPHGRVGGAEAGPDGQPDQQPGCLAGGRASRLIAWASSSAVSRRRLVTSTRLPPARGSSGRICSLLAASSRTSSSAVRPAGRARALSAPPGRPGSRPAGTPMVSSRLASASAGVPGRRPGVCPCNGKKICPPGNRPASRCAACTAKAVLPMPAIPPIAWMLTTPPAPAAASASSASSCCRPVNEAMSRGSVRVAATPLPRARPGITWPRGAASNSTRAEPPGPQRLGERPHRVLVRGGGQAPLQVADRPRAHPGRLGQLLLRQPGPGTQPPQHTSEPSRRLSHGLSSCPGRTNSG